MRVLVADDNELLRARLVGLLSGVPGVEVVGEAREAGEALRAVRESRPDLVTLDIHMCGGLGVLREIKRRAPAPVVLMLTSESAPPYRKCCKEAGADYFLDKADGPAHVRDLVSDLAARFDLQPT